MLRGTTQKKASPLAVILSCKTNLDIFQYMTQQYVTIVLATFFNFAHGVLYLRPVVYYSRCLLFFFLILSCSHDTSVYNIQMHYTHMSTLQSA